MTNKQLQILLSEYPDDMKVRLMPHHERSDNFNHTVLDLEDEHILVTSEEAYIDDEADPETWDSEDGKVVHKGNRFILINPIIY